MAKTLNPSSKPNRADYLTRIGIAKYCTIEIAKQILKRHDKAFKALAKQ